MTLFRVQGNIRETAIGVVRMHHNLWWKVLIDSTNSFFEGWIAMGKGTFRTHGRCGIWLKEVGIKEVTKVDQANT